MLNKEYYALQNSSEKQLVELESKCKEQGDKLAVYEKLEQELDDVIMQAAESKDTAKSIRNWRFYCRVAFGQEMVGGNNRVRESQGISKSGFQLTVESNLSFALVLLYFALWLVKKSRTTFSINQK